MTTYFRVDNPSDVRIIDDATIATWEATSNPKLLLWALQPPAPSPTAQWSNGAWAEPVPAVIARWLSFKTAMLSSPEVNAAMGQATPLAPLAVFSLPAALNAAVAGDTSDFAVTWTTLREAGLIPQPVLDAVAATAVACELPEEFVQLLGGGS